MVETSTALPIIPESDSGTLSLSLPQKEGKAGYLTSFLIARNEIFQIIKTMDRAYDVRLIFAMQALIGYIDDDEYRRALWDRYNGRLTEIGKTSPSAAEKNSLSMDETIYILGEITSYFDRVVGLSHKLEARLL